MLNPLSLSSCRLFLLLLFSQVPCLMVSTSSYLRNTSGPPSSDPLTHGLLALVIFLSFSVTFPASNHQRLPLLAMAAASHLAGFSDSTLVYHPFPPKQSGEPCGKQWLLGFQDELTLRVTLKASVTQPYQHRPLTGQHQHQLPTQRNAAQFSNLPRIPLQSLMIARPPRQ